MSGSLEEKEKRSKPQEKSLVLDSRRDTSSLETKEKVTGNIHGLEEEEV